MFSGGGGGEVLVLLASKGVAGGPERRYSAMDYNIAEVYRLTS